MRTFLAALLFCTILVSGPASHAASTAGSTAIKGNASSVTATIDRFGIYRTRKNTSLPEPGAGTGRLNVAGKAELIKSTDIVRGETGVEFGVEFTLAAPEGETVPVTVRMRHPSMVNPVTGARTERSEWTITPKTGESTYTGWEFTYDWEVRAGIWLLQLLHGTDLLAEQPFKVTPSLKRTKNSKDLVIDLTPSSSRKDTEPKKKTRLQTGRTTEKTTASTNLQPPVPLPAQPKTPSSPKKAEPAPPSDTSDNTPVALVQLGAFKDKAGAEVIADLIRRMGFNPIILLFESDTGHSFHTLVLGPFDDPRKAEKTAAKYRGKTQKPARVNFMSRGEFERLHPPTSRRP